MIDVLRKYGIPVCGSQRFLNGLPVCSLPEPDSTLAVFLLCRVKFEGAEDSIVVRAANSVQLGAQHGITRKGSEDGV